MVEKYEFKNAKLLSTKYRMSSLLHSLSRHKYTLQDLHKRVANAVNTPLQELTYSSIKWQSYNEQLGNFYVCSGIVLRVH